MKIPAKKRLGQHFLRDTGTLEKIVQFINPAATDIMFELGAGDGALTVKLASRVGQLIALEIDRDCFPKLHSSLGQYGNVVVIQEDMLHADFSALAASLSPLPERLRFVGNLPYNIATAVMRQLLLSELKIYDLTFLVQLEVAERITAKVGTRQYGVLSILCQHLCRTKIGFKVKPECFSPKPKVDSAIVRLQPSAEPCDPQYEATLLRLTKAAFGHRRKTLANSLRMDPAFESSAAELLVAAGIDGSRRGEDLSIQEYKHLTNIYLEIVKP